MQHGWWGQVGGVHYCSRVLYKTFLKVVSRLSRVSRLSTMHAFFLIFSGTTYQCSLAVGPTDKKLVNFLLPESKN